MLFFRDPDGTADGDDDDDDGGGGDEDASMGSAWSELSFLKRITENGLPLADTLDDISVGSNVGSNVGGYANAAAAAANGGRDRSRGGRTGLDAAFASAAAAAGAPATQGGLGGAWDTPIALRTRQRMGDAREDLLELSDLESVDTAGARLRSLSPGPDDSSAGRESESEDERAYQDFLGSLRLPAADDADSDAGSSSDSEKYPHYDYVRDLRR